MIRFMTIIILLGAAALPAWSQDVIGFVKTVTGAAVVIADGKSINARVGTPVKMGNTLKTGSDGAMGVTFKDNTVMSFGPDTQLTVDEYLYAPESDRLKFCSTMSKGTVEVVTGVIARLKPKSVTIKTPAAMIGCRGTRYLVKVDP